MPEKRDKKGRFVQQDFDLKKLSKDELKKYRHAIAQRKYREAQRAKKEQKKKDIEERIRKVRQAAYIQQKIRRLKGQKIVKSKKLRSTYYQKGKIFFEKVLLWEASDYVIKFMRIKNVHGNYLFEFVIINGEKYSIELQFNNIVEALTDLIVFLYANHQYWLLLRKDLQNHVLEVKPPKFKPL